MSVSLIFSNKSDLNGHKYRHTLVKRILDENLPVDIYGRGCRLYENYKTLDDINERFEIMMNHTFSSVILQKHNTNTY